MRALYIAMSYDRI